MKFEFKVTVHYDLWAKCTQLWPLKVPEFPKLRCIFYHFSQKTCTQSEQNWVFSWPSVAEGNTTFFFLGLIMYIQGTEKKRKKSKCYWCQWFVINYFCILPQRWLFSNQNWLKMWVTVSFNFLAFPVSTNFMVSLPINRMARWLFRSG